MCVCGISILGLIQIYEQAKGFNAPFNLPIQEMCIALDNIFYTALLGK